MAGNCTLKADNVCLEFLQDGVPGPEGIPSIPAISYIDHRRGMLLTDDIEVLSGPRSSSKLLQRCERSNGKDTHKVPRQYSHPFLLTKTVSRSSSDEMCPEEQDVQVQVIALLL